MTTIACWALAAAGAPLEGTWRVDIEVTSASKVMGFETNSSMHTVALLTENAEGRHLYRVCDLRPDGGLVHTTIPRAWIDSVPARYVSASELDGVVTVDLGTSATGFDPSSGPFPREDRSSVVDQDGDGHEGVTMSVQVPLVGSGDVYVAQRSKVLLRGAHVATDVVTGSVEVDMAHVVLGASRAVFVREAQVRPVPAASRFTLTAVAPTTTCGALI